MSCTAQGADVRRGREHSQFAMKPPQSRQETWACVNQDSDQTEWESSQAEAVLSPGSYVALCPCSSVGIFSFLPPSECLLCGLRCVSHLPWLLVAVHSSVCPALPFLGQSDWLIPASGVLPLCQELVPPCIVLRGPL